MIPDILKGFPLYEKDENLCRRIPFMLTVWVNAYPLVDLKAQIGYAHIWELCHNKKKNRIRFFSNWFRTAQENAKNNQTIVHQLPKYKESIVDEADIVEASMFRELKEKLKKPHLNK